MSNIFKNNEAIVHQSNKGETTVFPKNSIWYKIGFDTNMVTFRSRYNDEVIFYENDVTELTIDGKLPENFVTEFNQIAYGGGKPEIDYDILAVYNVTSTTSPTSLIYSTRLTRNIEAMYIDDIEVEIGNAATFDSTGEHVVKYKLNDNTNIDSDAFYNVYQLISIEVGNSVTSIGSSAFENCIGLTSVTIPNSVTGIGYNTFKNCRSLASVTIPNQVQTVGNYTFSGCTNLSSVTIGNSVTSIGESAFKSCNSLTSINIPDSVETIGDLTFNGCTSVSSITIGSGLKTIGYGAFITYSDIKSIIVNQNNTVYDSRENCNALIETETNTLFRGSSNTIIPDGVTSIGDSAFNCCSSLTELVIPNSVTSIGNMVFYYCDGLKSIDIPNSVEIIGNRCFAYSSFSSVTFQSITEPECGNELFFNNKLNGVLYYPCGSDYSNVISNLPSKWTSECFSNEIDYTFSATYNVNNVNSPATLYSKYQSYFQDNIEKMYINDEEIPISSTYQFPEIGEYEVKYKLKNTSLPDYAFYQTRTVFTIDLKDVTEIGLSVFENSFLKGELILGEKIERIGANAFAQTDITDVTIIPTFISCYNSRFKNCSNLSSVTSNEQFIWSSDFEGCGDLVVTNFPNLEEIGQKAFSRCVSLTSFTVPSSVKNISHKAFESCSNLTEIIFEMPTLAGVELGTNIFYDCTQHITIDYPCNADYEVLLNQIENYTTNCIQDQYDIKAVYQVITPNEEIVLFNEGDINFIPYLEKMYVDNVEIDLSTLIKVNESYQIGNRLVFAETGEHTVKYKLIDSCNFIQNASFLNITSLVSVNLAKDFVSIGYNAFEQCVNLHTVILPNSVEYIYNGAFYSCTSLTSVTLGEYVREIGWNAFERCHSLNFIEFMGTTAPTITSNSFADIGASGTIVHPCGYNYNVIRAALPNWYCECDLVETTDFDVLAAFDIDEASVGVDTPIAFELSNISQIYINEVPVGVVSSYTFNSAGQYLVKYKLIDSTTIKTVSGGTAMSRTLTGMFSSGTTSTLIGFTVKSACTKLYGVALMESVTTIDQASFAGCTGLSEVIFPSTLTNIKNYAFQGCSGLTEIDIPDSVTSIGNYTFYNCTSLTSATIGSEVTSIGMNAFNGCSSLSSITCNALTAPSIGTSTFNKVATNGVLKYPCGSDYSSWMSTEDYYLGKFGWTSECL